MDCIIKKRNYGIDLLRMVAMFMVVVLHVLGEGGVLNTLPAGAKNEVAWFFEILCYGAVNIYALITGFVFYNSERKWRNYISLWFQVAFYCVIFTTLDVIVNFKNTVFSISGIIKIITSAFLPALTNQYWYFTAYTALFLCIPILNVIIKHTPRAILKTSIIGLIFIFYFGERILSASAFGARDGYSFLWLAFLYVMGGYMAKYISLNRVSINKSLFLSFVCIVLTSIARIMVQLLIYLVKGSVAKSGYETLMLSYTCPTIVLFAVFLLNAFRKMNFGKASVKIISKFSPLAFGVYLIHTNQRVFKYMTNSFTFLTEYNAFIMILLVLGCAIAIYLACTIIELFRAGLFKLLRLKKLAVFIEFKINKVLIKLSKPLGLDDKE